MGGIAPGFYHSNRTGLGCDKFIVVDLLPTNPTLHKPNSAYYALVHLLPVYVCDIVQAFQAVEPLGKIWLAVGL